MHSRAPTARLAPFVSRIWATGPGATTHGAAAERVLPTGAMHLVLRLDSEPLRLLEDGEKGALRTLGSALVGGVRTRPYFKDVSRLVPSVGAVLEPGAASLLFGVPADALAGRHTPLDAIWGAEAERWCDALADLPTVEARLAALESRLARRLPAVRGLHPGVAHALACLAPGGPVEAASSVGSAAGQSGLSPRRLRHLFRQAAGLSPKRWGRLRRFQRAIRRATSEPRACWAEIALGLGYSDQPHFTREFREFSGLSPGEYRRLAPGAPNHVPLPEDPFSSRRERAAG